MIRRATDRLRRLFLPRGMILMYHRIGGAGPDPWGLKVSPDHFEQHLEVIQRYFHPLSLRSLLEAHREGKMPDRSITLTFDDGYADNLYKARPLLERYEIPATVFLITEALAGGQNFWWDELECALLHPETLPEMLELKIDGNSCEWQLGQASRYGLEERQGDRNRRPWEAVRGTRLALFYSVWERLVPLSMAGRREALEAIFSWAGAEDPGRENRQLSPDEVILLGQGGLVELGAHTVNHPSLPLLSPSEQLEEIQDSKAQIEAITGQPVTSFSYPHGDYTLETPALVQKAGYQCACAIHFRCVVPGTDPFLFPRFQVEDWDGEEFLKRLRGWHWTR